MKKKVLFVLACIVAFLLGMRANPDVLLLLGLVIFLFMTYRLILQRRKK